MLYIAWMVILSGHSIKNTSFKNFHFWAAHSEKVHKQVVYQSLGSPPPPPPGGNTQIGWKTRKYGLKHALHSLDGHFEWSQHQKHKFRKLGFLSCPGWKTAWAGCVPAPWEDPPPPPGGSTQIGWKTCKYNLKHAFPILDGRFQWSPYQKNKFGKLRFLSCPESKTA